jgi:PKD repeat protein
MLLLMFSYWNAAGQCDSQTTVNDGSFESIQSPCTPGQNQYTEAFNDGCMGDWFAGKGTPTLIKTGTVSDNSGVINTPSGGGSYFAEVHSRTTGQTPPLCQHEALVLDLTLDPGCSYDITLWSRIYDHPLITGESSELTVYFTSGITNALGATGPQNCLSAPMDAETQTVNSFTWAQYSFNIPAETGDDQLVIFATSTNSTNFRTLIDLVTVEVCESDLNPGFVANETGVFTYQFNDLTSTTATNSAVEWCWDFGDGTYAYTQNPSHTFPDSQPYTVCLTIKDEDGCTAKHCQGVVAQPLCDCLDDPLEINSDQTWTSDQAVNHNLIVRTGKTLELDLMTLNMAPDCKIYVERGAKLEAIKSTLTTGCTQPDKYWSGIEVWGNGLVSHPPLSQITSSIYPYLPDHHGVVILAQCDITKAHIGVLTDNLANNGHETYWQPYGTWGNHYGGIVYALKSTFTDNLRAAHIAAFPANLPGAPTGATNLSQFVGCTIQDPSNISTRGISVWGSEGVLLQGNDFLGLNSHSLSFDNATGDVYENRFENFETGIKITNTAGFTAGFNMEIGRLSDPTKGNDFLNGSPVGVWAENAQNLEIHYNTFETNFVPIAISGPSFYRVTHNSFIDFFRGVQLQNTFALGDLAWFNCNYFEETANVQGVTIWGNNGEFEFNQETFNIPAGQDMRLTDSGIILGEIDAGQGSATNPLLNLFSGTQHIIAPPAETNSFFYFHPGTNLTTAFPTLTFVPDNTGQNFTNVSITLNMDEYEDGCLDLEGVGDRPREEECKTEECLDSLNNLLGNKRSLIDGGDTESLQNSLAQAPNEQSTFDVLSNAAPYLSDEVLLAVLSSGMELPNQEAILFQNAPVSTLVLNTAQGTISDDTYQALIDIRASEGYSAMEALLAEISDLSNQYFAAFHYLYQTAFKEGDWAMAENLLLEDGSFSSTRKLIGLKLRTGAFSEAQAYLTALLVETDDQSIVADLLELEVAYRSNPIDYTLSDGDEAFLQLLAEDTLSATYTYSRALLGAISGVEFHLPIAPDATVEGLAQQDQGAAVPQHQKSRPENMVIMPNPAQGQVTVSLPIDVTPEWQLELWNVSGIAVRSLEISSNQHNFNLKGLPAGFYVVKAINKVEQVELQQRLIVR